MTKTLSYKVALEVARADGYSFLGMSVFDGRWYTANCRADLERIGCVKIEEVRRP